MYKFSWFFYWRVLGNGNIGIDVYDIIDWCFIIMTALMLLLIQIISGYIFEFYYRKNFKNKCYGTSCVVGINCSCIISLFIILLYSVFVKDMVKLNSTFFDISELIFGEIIFFIIMKDLPDKFFIDGLPKKLNIYGLCVIYLLLSYHNLLIKSEYTILINIVTTLYRAIWSIRTLLKINTALKLKK